MRCFETIELHPQGPEDLAALARAEAHAEGCAACGERLSELRAADRALQAELARYVDSSCCPEPEALAAWYEGERREGEVLSHLSACADCRADLFELLSDDAVEASSDSFEAVDHRAPIARPFPILPWAAAAGFLLVALVGLRFAASGPAAQSAQLPVQPLDVKRTPTPIKVAPAPTLPVVSEPVAPQESGLEPVLEPRVAPSPASEPVLEPAAEPTAPVPPIEPEQAPRASTPAPAPSEPTAPSDPTPAPEASEPARTPAKTAKPTQPLQVGSSDGIYLRGPEGSRYAAFEKGEVPVGASLRSGQGGGRVDLAQGSVYLAQGGELRWGESLALERGQVVLEGRGLRVAGLGAEIEVRGRVLVEVRSGKVGVQVLVGEARVARAEGSHELATGEALLARQSGKARLGRSNDTSPQQAPEWVRNLRPGRLARPGRAPGGRGGPGGRGQPPRRGGGR